MKRKYADIALARIMPNPWNPRKSFKGPKFDELLESIRSNGVIVPILVRPIEDIVKKKKKEDIKEFQIVAGERRYRASCKLAEKNGGLQKCTIPAIVKDLTDDEAFEILTIENLQREDLTELEEARSFQAYIDRKGGDAITVLAEKTAINPRYIRRRVAVLKLPEKVLAAWEKGTIAFGHCEQLCRIGSEKKVLEHFKRISSYEEPVRELRRHIDDEAILLGHALFEREIAGCPKCEHNSDVQRDLFGDDSAIAGTSCLDPACFKKHQNEHFLSNWAKKYRKKYGTNGFRFWEGWGSREFNNFKDNYGYGKDPGEKCSECKSFITVLEINGKAHYKQACAGDVKCFQSIRMKPQKAEKKAGKGEAAIPAADEPRVSWHGRHFREEFYQVTLPGVFEQVPADDARALRIALAAILNSNREVRRHFILKYTGRDMDRHYFMPFEPVWHLIEQMDSASILAAIKAMALLVALQKDTTDHSIRGLMAAHLGVDLARDWRITPEYLEKKTTAEILDFGEKLGIFTDPKAEAFLKDTLKKKKFTALKKGELVRLVLESGVELAGKVPDEILRMEPEREYNGGDDDEDLEVKKQPPNLTAGEFNRSE